MVPRVGKEKIMMTLQEIEIINDHDGCEIVITDKDGNVNVFNLSKVEKRIIITEKDLTVTK